METYPTCLRQTGIAIGSISGNAIGVLGPYIVHLGTLYDVRYPILAIAIMSVIGAVSSSFLPETLHQKLPETLAEAQMFGADQPFWSLPKPPKGTADNADVEKRAEEEKLNQKKFSK